MGRYDLFCGAKRGTLKCARNTGHEGDHACLPPVSNPNAKGRELVVWPRKGGDALLVTERVDSLEADG